MTQLDCQINEKDFYTVLVIEIKYMVFFSRGFGIAWSENFHSWGKNAPSFPAFGSERKHPSTQYMILTSSLATCV